MKKGWTLKKLGDIVTKASSNISQNQLANEKGNYPIYGAGGFIRNVSFYHQDKEYISIVKDGAGIGRIAILPAYSSVIGTLQYLIPKENIDTKFLYYILDSVDFNKYRNGSTIPHIYFKDYSEELVSIPPLPEQQRIVSVLDEAFASIAGAKSNAERNLVNARELFESVLAEIYDGAGTHWEEKNLGDIASEMQTGPFGSTLHKSDYVANGIPVINPQNIVDEKIVPLQKMMVNQKTKERLSRYILQEKDIVLARRGEMGRCAIVEKEQAGWLCGSGSFVVRIKKEVDANYLVRYLSSAKVKRILQKGSVGTTMDNLNQGILSQVPVPFPPLAEQRAIVGRLEALSAETGRLEEIYQEKIESLEELKKSVLANAFAGEI